MSKVFIGIGHGGNEPGAVANGFKEKDLNLSIGLWMKDELERHGVEVRMSRTKDENDALTEEIRECNAFNPDLAIDVHNNAGGGDGCEFFYHIGGGLSKTFAENLEAEVKAIGQNSRGIKTKANSVGTDWYGFIRETKAPAVIAECAFVDNANDIKIIDTEEERKVMGIALAKGALKTLGIEHTEGAAENVYIVKGGDTLSAIAEKYGKTWKELADYNGITNPHIIWVGQKIKIPTEAVKTPELVVGSTVKVKNGAKDYNGTKLADFVYTRSHKVKEINGDRVVITYRNAVVCAINKKNLVLA